MALVKCTECGQEISDKATACPRCGAPAAVKDGSPTIKASNTEVSGGAKASSKQVSIGRQIFGIVIAVIIVVVAYRGCLDQEQRDAVNRVSSVVGLTVTPWIDRAQAAFRSQLAKENQQGLIAISVVGSLHPTGTSPRLESFRVDAIGDTLVASFTVAWIGGIFGTPYTTVVNWKCTKTQNLGVELVSDDGPFGVGESNLKTLGDWFQTEVYPVLLSNAD